MSCGRHKDVGDLENKLVIVTGAGRGNGASIARGMAGEGGEVWGIDLNFPGMDMHHLSRSIIGDVADPDFVASTCAEAISTGREIVLVNNAGVTLPSPRPYPNDKWFETIRVNLTAPFLWIEGVSPAMINCNGGSIINITSLAAERAFPDNPAYAASKGGLKQLSKSYAKTLGAFNVRVNNVGPGYIRTSMTSQSFANSERRELLSKQTLLGRLGETKDLVGVCLFLAGPNSSYITGQDIYVDGGWLANGVSD